MQDEEQSLTEAGFVAQCRSESERESIREGLKAKTLRPSANETNDGIEFKRTDDPRVFTVTTRQGEADKLVELLCRKYGLPSTIVQ